MAFDCLSGGNVTAQTQKAVTFYGDTLIAIRQDDSGAIFVPLARLCDSLGIARARQAQRIREHPVISRGFETLNIETPGGAQEAQCLRLDMIPLWLSGVNANRVSDAVREKLIRYQTEVATVLWDAFKHEILPVAELAPPPTERSGAELAYEIATAVQHLARQQMEIEQRLGGRIDTMARWAKRTDERISSLELRLTESDEQISEAQAAELALAVKTVANALVQHGAANGYQRVYGELYRRYSISSYKSLPRRRLQEALEWLRSWYQEVDGAGANDL
jgi:hypothetical protein